MPVLGQIQLAAYVAFHYSRGMRILLIFLLLMSVSFGQGDELMEKALKGDAHAQFSLGMRYAKGKTVPKDAAEAVKWYRKAAEQGHTEASMELGVAYIEGLEPLNQGQALRVRDAIDKRGYVGADELISYFYTFDLDVQKDDAEGLKWFRKAADHGHPYAQYFLGSCYNFGQGVRKDRAKAYVYYNLASSQIESSRFRRDILEKIMSPQEVAAGQKRVKEMQKEIEGRMQKEKNPPPQ